MPLIKGISRMEIVKDIVSGLSKAAIAKKRKISASTVDYHLTMAKKEGLFEKVRQQSGLSSRPAEALKPESVQKPIAAKPAPSLPQTVEETTTKWWNSLSIGQKLDLMMSAGAVPGGQFREMKTRGFR